MAKRTATKRSTSQWNHDIADPQRGKEHLAESANIDDAQIGIESLQRRMAYSHTILAVVIIFDDPGACVCAQLSSCNRRDALIVAPRGYWWDGVTKAARLADNCESPVPRSCHRDRRDGNQLTCRRQETERSRDSRIFHPHRTAQSSKTRVVISRACGIRIRS